MTDLYTEERQAWIRAQAKPAKPEPQHRYEPALKHSLASFTRRQRQRVKHITSLAKETP